MPGRNQVFQLTAPGVSAIAVVRITGPEALDFLSRHFSAQPRDDRPVYGRLSDGVREVDDPVVIWDADRHSADICVHGGKWVVLSVLELLGREGFELIESSAPLPEIAADADDSLDREILQWLPLARTREAIATLLGQREAWRGPGELDRERILKDRSLYWLLHPPRIAIIGIPNAGKSTLANALFGQERSIVADVPGTTRDYVEEYANLGGLPVRLVDTPGLRATGDGIEAAAIGISLGEISSADLRILLLDPTQAKGPQAELAARYPDALRVSGKADLTRSGGPLEISAATGQGVAELELAIRRRFGSESLPHNRRCLWMDSQRERFVRSDSRK
jgi:tRNA modification GTPase